MDEIRQRIISQMTALGISESALSLQLGRNRSYVFQYLKQGTPRDLPYAIKLRVAEVLNMPYRDLGIVPPGEAQRPNGVGLAEDADPYIPPDGAHLSQASHIAFFVMKSRALDQMMPTPVLPGQILAFDINKADPASIPNGKVVVVQLLDKRDLAKSHGTVIRLFLAPNKLVTHSSERNEIISLDDETLEYEPVIKGTLVAATQQFN